MKAGELVSVSEEFIRKDKEAFVQMMLCEQMVLVENAEKSLAQRKEALEALKNRTIDEVCAMSGYTFSYAGEDYGSKTGHLRAKLNEFINRREIIIRDAIISVGDGDGNGSISTSIGAVGTGRSAGSSCGGF